MLKLEVNIEGKLFKIECSNCPKMFIKTFDELAILGIVKCPSCGQEHFIASIK